MPEVNSKYQDPFYYYRVQNEKYFLNFEGSTQKKGIEDIKWK